MMTKQTKGRFAPSPSGRMHLGNIYTALLSWLSVKSKNGQWLLRIEDLDPQRSKKVFAEQIEDDLNWLGLDWDEGGMAEGCCQSLRNEIYEEYFEKLQNLGLTYKCYCTRTDLRATQAPHISDGRFVYSGRCRPKSTPPFPADDSYGATRIFVPNKELIFEDRICGKHIVNLADFCGDFIIRRADKAWAYQLAVVVDDALMGVTEVVRGDDLLMSTAQQLYLYSLLGFDAPEFAHVPLVRNEDGIRLSKRDSSMSMEYMRSHYTPEEIIGNAAFAARLTRHNTPVSAQELLERIKQFGAHGVLKI